jgi:CheY-like chemotaxis protein
MTTLTGVRLLLVEDDADTRNVLATGLRQLGCEVFVAGSAQVALLALQRQPPDALLIDIGLPDVNGCDLLRAVRRLRPLRGWDVPAIAVTALGSPEDRLATVRAGFRTHLTKPVEASTLADAVLSVLRERQAS